MVVARFVLFQWEAGEIFGAHSIVALCTCRGDSFSQTMKQLPDETRFEAALREAGLSRLELQRLYVNCRIRISASSSLAEAHRRFIAARLLLRLRAPCAARLSSWPCFPIGYSGSSSALDPTRIG